MEVLGTFMKNRVRLVVSRELILVLHSKLDVLGSNSAILLHVTSWYFNFLRCFADCVVLSIRFEGIFITMFCQLGGHRAR